MTRNIEELKQLASEALIHHGGNHPNSKYSKIRDIIIAMKKKGYTAPALADWLTANGYPSRKAGLWSWMKKNVK